MPAVCSTKGPPTPIRLVLFYQCFLVSQRPARGKALRSGHWLPGGSGREVPRLAELGEAGRMAASDEAVQQFVSVTAASVEEARRYIEVRALALTGPARSKCTCTPCSQLCGGSVDQAVNMFWDAPLPSGQSTPGTCPRTGPPHASGEEECGAALRFRLKPRAANRREFHRVRAPIASKHDVLVEGPSDSLMGRSATIGWPSVWTYSCIPPRLPAQQGSVSLQAGNTRPQPANPPFQVSACHDPHASHSVHLTCHTSRRGGQQRT